MSSSTHSHLIMLSFSPSLSPDMWQNVLPPSGPTADITIFIDSLSLDVWIPGALAAGQALPVQVVCVEAGAQGESLPGLALR